jgi:hypothetical protein
MSVKFAEQILDGMVDEDGNCGERGISAKQYRILTQYLTESERKNDGGWEGDYAYKQFCKWDEWGYIGKYYVELEAWEHFNLGAAIKSVRRWIDEVPTFENSQWVGEPKKRMELTLTLINDYSYERPSYSGYGYDMAYIYTLADDEGNCYVWKTTNNCFMVSSVEATTKDGREIWADRIAEKGDRITLKATVKEHSEYKGIKQTIINRPKVLAIA